MVGGRKREVLFFGSLAVSVAGHNVYDDDIAAQLKRQNAFIKLRTTVTAPYHKTDEAFSAVATSPLYEINSLDALPNGSDTNNSNSNTTTLMASSLGAPQQLGESVGGIVGTHRRSQSPSQQQQQHRHHQHRHNHRQRAAFLPVMLELARGAVAEDVPSIEEMDRSLTSAAAVATTISDAASKVTIYAASAAAAAVNISEANGGGSGGSAEAAKADYASASLRIEVDMSRSGSRTGPVAIQDVFLPSLNYLARHDICTLVRIPLLASTIQKTAIREVDAAVVARESAELQSTGSIDGPAAGVALNLYVVVRVVSLAEKLRLIYEADDEVRAFLEMEEAAPSTLQLTLTQRGDAPYGAVPLTELYRHYKRFFEQAGNCVLKHGDAIMQRLVAAPRQREAEASFPHRWNTLTEMDLRPLMLGEKAFAPLLLTLAHCTNLRSLHADGNQLSDLTCGRLAILFRHHRYLAYIGLTRNNIHEAGGEQLIRLLKTNLRITSMPCEGNYFSDAMQQRVAATTAKNARVIANDPLNIFSKDYGYLTELSSLPEVTQRQALRTWAMLSAAPVGDVDVMVRNLTTSSQRTIGDSPQVAMQRAKLALRARETFSLIPPAAFAPLLNEVMRTVYVTVSRMLRDPLVRSLFSDVETIVVKQQEQKDTQAESVGNSVQHENTGGGGDSASCTTVPPDAQAALGGPCRQSLNAEKLFARSFLRIIVTVFRGLMLATPWSDTVEVLAGIGRMHQDLGVMAEDYWLAVHVFMAAVRISCGAESYDADHASSFLALLALAVRTTAGFDVQLV